MDEALCDFLSSMQSRLFDFYKEGKLTDVTWIVDMESGEEEYIDAHSSICALSFRLKELMLAHSKGQPKSRIRVPPSLTSSPSDIRGLLHLAYTGSFEEGRSLDEYFRLCELFDMPLGIDICLRRLNNLLIELLFRPKVDDETQNSLRDFFIHFLSNSSMEPVHQIMLEFFRVHPLIFDCKSTSNRYSIRRAISKSLVKAKSLASFVFLVFFTALNFRSVLIVFSLADLCLSNVPFGWFMELVESGRLWMQNADGFVYFGEHYMSKVTQLVERVCLAHNTEPKEVKVATTNSMFAPLCISTFTSPAFGYHALYAPNYNYRKLEGEHRTHDNYPPNKWKIAALTGYITRNWDGRHVLAGLDVTYRNLETGTEETVDWGRYEEEHYIVQTISVPEDDVITGFEINHGWLIDRVIFTTRKGTRLNQLGNSDGGSTTIFDVSNFSSGITQEWIDEERTERSPHGEVVVSLHGISYKEISSHRQILWNEVVFHFASINRPLVEALNPEQGPSIHQVLKNKQILL